MRDVIVTLTYTEAEAREVMRALHYFDSNVSASEEDHDRMNLIRSAISRILPPPKPDEPKGLGAVVRDEDGHRWTRTNNAGEWFCECGDDVLIAYDEVRAVRVLSEGVTA